MPADRRDPAIRASLHCTILRKEKGVSDDPRNERNRSKKLSKPAAAGSSWERPDWPGTGNLEVVVDDLERLPQQQTMDPCGVST